MRRESSPALERMASGNPSVWAILLQLTKEFGIPFIITQGWVVWDGICSTKPTEGGPFVPFSIPDM